MNNNAQNGSFYNVTDNQILLTYPGQDAFYHTINRTTRPKWLVLRKLCELIVLRVIREVIIFNNSNFMAVEKTASMRMGGLGVEPLNSLWLRHCADK